MKRPFNRDRLAIELRRNDLGTASDRGIDLRSRQIRHDQVGNAEALADAQVALDPVTEQRMDDAATVSDRDQAGGFLASAGNETQPFLWRDTGVVHIYHRVSGTYALPVYGECLEVLIHRRIPIRREIAGKSQFLL
jgi:hypothetical protein